MTRLKSAFRNYVMVVLPEFYEYGTNTERELYFDLYRMLQKINERVHCAIIMMYLFLNPDNQRFG